MLGHMATHHLPSIGILDAYDNTYTMESKDELVFVNFFFCPIPFVVYNKKYMFFF
jgi:hypothetical protein